jgi:nickel-dependent lactate racemase
MNIRLAYGKHGLEIDLPAEWNVTVIEPEFVPGLSDPVAALKDALENPLSAPPLHTLVDSNARVGIVFSDITRPSPSHLLLPAVLQELGHIPPENITMFNALGTHRPNSEAELRAMLGDALVDEYRIVQNNAFDPSTQISLGMTSFGHEIWLNREFVECDLKILTGFNEPHLFAGFSGGGKAIMPGMAGQRTILGNHDAGMIANPNATWGVIQDNPIWQEMREIALKCGDLFLLNVALNKNKQITGVFAGDLDAAHAAGCAFVRNTAMIPVPEAFDIVITTNSGYPLDLNLYQSVKGMSAAALVVRPGGAIIVAADCWDGIPEHGLYARLLREAGSPQALLEKVCAPGFLEQDQWQVQIQVQIQLKAEVYVRSGNLSDEQIRQALLTPCHSIENTIASLLNKYGSQASICVLPEGPQTIPYIQTERVTSN